MLPIEIKNVSLNIIESSSFLKLLQTIKILGPPVEGPKT
jgi:hypothetical protein